MTPAFGHVHGREEEITATAAATTHTSFMGSTLAAAFAGTLTAGAAFAGVYGAKAAGIGHAALSLGSLGALLAAILVATVLDRLRID